MVAIILYESDATAIDRVLTTSQSRSMSAVTRFELSAVIEGRHGPAGRAMVDEFLAVCEIAVVPVAESQVTLAIEAFRRFGRGRHPAALNFGDCFVYALARDTGLPLLCKGNDFAQTDITLVAV